MVNEPVTFGVTTLTSVVGLAIMLYGVSLTAGQSLNTFQIAGGAIVLVAIGIQTFALMGIDNSHGAESGH